MLWTKKSLDHWLLCGYLSNRLHQINKYWKKFQSGIFFKLKHRDDVEGRRKFHTDNHLLIHCRQYATRSRFIMHKQEYNIVYCIGITLKSIYSVKSNTWFRVGWIRQVDWLKNPRSVAARKNPHFRCVIIYYTIIIFQKYWNPLS